MPLQLLKQCLDGSADRPALPISPEVLIIEANHRIANNLTMIAALGRLQAEEVANKDHAISPGEARLMLLEVSTRVETVSRLHRLLSQASQGEDLDVGFYLREIALAVINSMATTGPTPRLDADVRGCMLRSAQALSAGFIVGELVTNSVKYAHPAGAPGEIRLRCIPTADGSTIIELADDGVGFPDGFDPEKDGGLGLRLVRSLAAQLEARLTFEQDGLGLRTQVSIPPVPQDA